MAKTVSQEDVFSDGVFWEAVNLTMASLCGITVPPFTYDNGWLCVQRFDRENSIPVPYISAKTLLLAHGAHEDYRHNSYAGIADRCNEKDAQEVFRRCCFNVAVANCDDHLKNRGFLLKNGDWILSPVFDVMSMPVPACAQEHSLCCERQHGKHGKRHHHTARRLEGGRTPARIRARNFFAARSGPTQKASPLDF